MKIKFRTNVAVVSEEKSSDDYIDSGATHHFFYSQSVFMNCSTVNKEPVKGATRITKILAKEWYGYLSTMA